MKRCVYTLALTLILSGCKGKPATITDSPATPQPVIASTPMQPQTSSAPTATPVNAPRWDWQKFDDEIFETKPSQGRVFAVPENASRLRVQLTASSPVDSAAMSRDTFKSAKGVVREDHLIRQPCASIGISQDVATCPLNPKDSMVYVVRDRRALSADPIAMAQLQKQAERRGGTPAMMAPDKIHITLSIWACVANCGPLGGPAQ